MKRRDASIALVVLAVAPLDGRSQPTAKSHRIGFLGLSSAHDYSLNLDAFLTALRELGYEEGRNLKIDYRWADGREERLPELAVQLVQLRPDVLVSHSVGVRAAQKATSTIPIVMGVSADPVADGLVQSLAKPGGNTTGVASRLTDLAAKRLELLKEAVPTLRRVAVLSNPALPALVRGLEETEIAARKLGVRLRAFSVTGNLETLESLFDAILRDRPDGLVVQPDPITGKHGVPIARFATTNRLPAVGGDRQFAANGGLLAYGGSFVDGWRLAARYVDKILKGAKPGDLPVEQATTFELVINLKTAKEVGLTLPHSLLSRANEVLQ